MDIVNKFSLEAQDLYEDPDLVLTEKEIKEIKESIESGFINSKDIDWDYFEDLEL